MKQSLRTVLEHIIDYAGLYPPAKLELHEAIGNYLAYRESDESWMLGRFICPAPRLGELEPYADRFATRPLRVSATFAPAESREAFLEALSMQAQRLGLIQKRLPWITIEMTEVRLPDDLTVEQFEDFLSHVEQCFRDAGVGMPLEVYEIPHDEAALELVRQLGRGRLRTIRDRQRVLIKLRCGGPKPESIPPAALVAKVIHTCRESGVPLKFTAGLHHPFRHVDPVLQCPMHGFLNLLVAGVLAYALRLDEPDVRAIVEETDPWQFTFEDEYLAWNEAEATLGEIRFARRHHLMGFGSCSFTEPIEDLRQLGLMQSSK